VKHPQQGKIDPFVETKAPFRSEALFNKCENNLCNSESSKGKDWCEECLIKFNKGEEKKEKDICEKHAREYNYNPFL
jgi:hypothetical protein